jgi:hypothetical protein
LKMKKALLLIFVTLLFSSAMLGMFFTARAGAAPETAPETVWSYAFEEGEGHFVEQTRDGGLILTGWIESGGAGSDVFLAKYDSAGSRLWQYTYRGNGFSDGHCVREVSGGGFIIAGETKSVDAYDHDVYVVRTDSKGVLLWEKTFGGVRCDYAWSVQQTKDGGFIIAGGTESFGAGIYDVYLIKLDASGNEIWEKTYGGPASDCGYAVLQADDGGYVIAGNAESFGTGNPDVYLLKTDSEGNMVWQKTYGGSGSDYGWSLLKAPAGGFIIAGEKEVAGDQGSGFAAYLLKLNSAGEKIWENTYGGGSVSSFYGACLASGGYALTGKIESAGGYGLYAVKIAEDGSLAWEKTVEGTGVNSGYAIAQTRDGAFVVAGKKGIEKSAASEIIMLKLKATSKEEGAFLWSAAAAVVVFAIVLLILWIPSARKGGVS